MSATNLKIRRLPGFRFEAQTMTREDILPRMDVALFVGFAAKGPIGIPVVLESAEQFADIFGKDLPLVWDKNKGGMIFAHLAPAVRMFFRNGGRRCWVIRTAKVSAEPENQQNRAAYNFFPLPGLAGIDFDNPSKVMPVFARARSKGSWSDDLRVATATVLTALKFKNLQVSDENIILSVETSANDPVKNGDLLRLDFPESDLILFLTADKIENENEQTSPSFSPTFGKSVVKIIAERFVWLESLPDENFPDPENSSVRMWCSHYVYGAEDASHITFLEKQAEIRFEKGGKNTATGERETKVHLIFSDFSLSDAPAEGSLAVAEFQGKLLCLQVETVFDEKPENGKKIHLICNGVFVVITGVKFAVGSPASLPDVEKLSFEIWIKEGETNLTKLSDLSFNDPHERFWGNLLTDDEFYSFSENEEQDSPENPSRLLTSQLLNSPIAGSGDRGGFFIPVFPTALAENYLGAIELQGTKLQRDGLQVFDEKLFLDEKLKNTGLNNLLNEAEFIRYLSPNPRRLWGIHSALAPETVTVASAESVPTNPAYALFSLDEATIIAVPDAVHRGWFQNDEKSSVSRMPKPFAPPLRPEWWRFQDCRKPDIKPVAEPLRGNFLDCDLKIIEPPEDFEVEENEISDGTFTLVWKHDADDENLVFVLEESSTPEFEFPQEIYRNQKSRFEIRKHGAGIFYFRVRAEIGNVKSNWSDGLAIKIPAAENWTAKLLEEEKTSDPEKKFTTDVLLAVQRALLRMCAARGDMFAVLDLPEHFEKDEAVRHIATLKAAKGMTAPTAQVEPFSADEKMALSFGAVYHPWLLTREEGFEAVRQIPASGAVCGVFAKRSLTRGAWLAPANEALQNVLGLGKEFGHGTFLDFQDALVNLVRHEPTGFLVLNSDTLSDDPDLRQINVRRLLSLLRRLALKHGAEYVFEPNNERFRRSVQRGFNALLDKMFVRGAFAGATPATSYQVVVSDTINNFQSLEQGRFIVELRVAPSLPLKFVTVRLINAGGRTSVLETV